MPRHTVSTERYLDPPANECVYCGEKEGLSEEHIIPFGLNGTLVIPSASCKDCAGVTSAFELSVQRGFMYRTRIVTEMSTRRKKKRPKKIRTKLSMAWGSEVEKEILTGENLAVLHLPLFPPPGLMTGRFVLSGGLIQGVDSICVGKAPHSFLMSQGATGFRIDERIDLAAFMRLIAKIAFCYLRAERGPYPREESPVLDLILGKRSDFGNWIGCGTFSPTLLSNNSMHVISIESIENDFGENGVVVRVKLFSCADPRIKSYDVITRLPNWKAAFRPTVPCDIASPQTDDRDIG